jgi:two-component system phosphate regulon sensor histidine kinase PhoR
MTVLPFFLGLGIGIGLWLWQYTRIKRKQRSLLHLFPGDTSSVSLSTLPSLRRQIVLLQQQQQDLHSQLQTWQQLLQVAPVGYLQVDEENQLLWCNQQAQQLLGLARWEPKQVRLLLELVRSYELDSLIEQTREQQQPEVREWVFHPASSDAAMISGLKSLTLRATSLPLPEGQVGVFLENRQPLVDLTQTRDRQVSDLAHELKTPLTSILLVAETLQQQLQPPQRQWVERLLPEIDRLINLVQSWLELSHLEIDHNRQLNCQPVELRSLIRGIWQTLEPLAQGQKLNLSYSGSEVWLNADKDRLTQVFLNLLHNSIKYSPFQGTIRVIVKSAVETNRKQVQINIIDSGEGFPAMDLPHVFERLYRGDPARAKQSASLSDTASPGTTGSGLGLAIVQQIVQAHGGSVKAMNHPDGGAWLQVELPTL